MDSGNESQLADRMKTIVEGTIEALATLLGKDVSFELDGIARVAEPPAIDNTEERVIAEVALSGGVQGNCILMCGADNAGRLVDLMMGGDGSPKAALAGEQVTTLGELINQATGAAVSTAGTAFGIQCSHSVQRVFLLGQDSVDTFNNSLDYPIVRMMWSMGIGDGLVLRFEQMVERRLAEALAAGTDKPEAASPEATAAAPEGALSQDEMSKLLRSAAEEEPQRKGIAASLGRGDRTPSEGDGQAKTAGAARKGVKVQSHEFSDIRDDGTVTEPRKLDMLLDVPLHLTVELGKTKRLVKDVLQLGPGSVLELDKAAGEAVDVLINGRLIAKAEVVVIDENFGVRITEIVSRTDRLKELKQQQ